MSERYHGTVSLTSISTKLISNANVDLFERPFGSWPR
jgi:hypothetical protein